MKQRPLLAFCIALVSLVAALTITITVVEDTDETGKRHREVHIRATFIDNADSNRKRDDKLVLSEKAQDVAESPGGDVDDPQRGPDKTPASVIRGPLASQEWPGCKTAFVKSFSQRTTQVKAIALHFTAGANVAGWGDIDGLTAYSNNLRNQVSWHFSIDREGLCAYNVPLNQKAWTISGLNSATVNIEGVGRGNEPDYLDGAGFKRLSAVVRRIGSIEGIPMRLGATDGNCHVTRPGIITHWMGGPCSGGHTDIRPYDIRAIVARIARDASASSGIVQAKRSHRIVHAKIRARCRTRLRPAACTAYYRRNGELHAKYPNLPK